MERPDGTFEICNKVVLARTEKEVVQKKYVLKKSVQCTYWEEVYYYYWKALFEMTWWEDTENRRQMVTSFLPEH